MDQSTCTAFAGPRRIASGELNHVALKTKEFVDRNDQERVLVFDDSTGEQVELDLRGTAADVLKRLGTSGDAISQGGAARGPGRPRLGVVAREVTLLPRHWEWLSGQPGGASVALRRLVDEARRANAGRDRERRSQETAYRFLSAIAGNFPGFEEVARALFAGNRARFDELVEPWPADVRDHARTLAAASFPPAAEW